MPNPLSYDEIAQFIKDRLVFNTSVESPISPNELDRAIQDAYERVYNAGLSRVRRASSVNIWGAKDHSDPTQPKGAQCYVGVPFVDSNVPQLRVLKIDRLICTQDSGDWQPPGTLESGGAQVTEMEFYEDPWEIKELLAKRPANGRPTAYSLERMRGDDTFTSYADMDKMRLWLNRPPNASYYFPGDVITKPFDLDSVANLYPDLTWSETKDLALIASIALAPAAEREELIPQLASEVSQRLSASLRLANWVATLKKTER